MASARSPGEQVALDNARECVELEAAWLEERALLLLDDDYRRGTIAMRLAPDVETYRALMRGEQVHPFRLDQGALERVREAGLWQ